MEYKTIAIILPSLNEESTIGKVIDEIPMKALEKEGYHVSVVVVDNNSSDRTREIAKEKGASILIEKQKGKGAAVRTGLQAAKADFIFMLDADYTYPATYIPEMLEILRHGPHVVLGTRLRGQCEKGAISLLNMVGNYLLTFMANTLFQTTISDLCTGYVGLRQEVIPNLKLSAKGFEFEAELFTELAKKGYHIAEVPIYYRRREGKSKLSNFKDGIKIGLKLITGRFR